MYEIKRIPNKILPFLKLTTKPLWKLHAANYACIIIGATLEAFAPYFIKMSLDVITGQQPTPDVLKQLAYIILLFVVYRAVVILVWQGSYSLWAHITSEHRLKLRPKVLPIILGYDTAFYQNNFSGQLAQKFLEGMYQSAGVLRKAGDLLYALVLPIAVSFFMATLHPLLGGVITLWIVIYIAVIIFTSKPQMYRSTNLSESKSIYIGQVVDLFSNNIPFKLFARSKTAVADLEPYNKCEALMSYKYHKTDGFIKTVRSIFHTMLTLSLLVTSAYLWSTGEITVAIFATAMAYGNVVSNKCAAIASAISDVMERLGMLESALRHLGYEPKVKDNSSRKIAPKAYDISFKDVHFHYGSKRNNVLTKFNLNIKEGQKIALVGHSGAGKTTLVSLLLRFFDPEKGQVLINGQDISRYTQESVRSLFSVIPQDTTLFNRTLMENIRYGNPNATDEEVIEASKKAYAHEFISKLSNGYDTLVGERGLKLSGGQRQRIAIARAILKDAPILVLDEATSALDSHSEGLIQKSLKNIMRGKTVVAIAHRLSTIAHMDCIIVLNEGKIVEDGTHDDLLKQNGEYAKLWAKQSNGWID